MTDATEERFADDAHRYRLDSRIATGGMGEVWRATDTVLGRPVAVKLLKHEYADDASFRSRFETEARHAASLHHPGVAAIFDFGEASATDGSEVARPFLVMELVDGQPLSALIRPGAPMDPEVTRDLIAQAADAIGAAHAAGIVHRDVKPANLLVTPAREVKITDFGIARAADNVGLTQTGQVMGTPQYLSPEQARGEAATPASDVYSLGCVAFECLAGERPFSADSPIATALAHLREPVPPLPESVPADLAGVVRRAMAKSPADRFPDATAFAAALRDPSSVALPPPVTPLEEPLDQPTQSTQVLAGAGAGLGAAAAAGAYAADAEPATGATGTPTGTPVGTPPPTHRDRRALPWVLIGAVVLLLVLVVGFLAFAKGGDSTTPTQNPTQQKSRPKQTSGSSSTSSSTPTTTAPSTSPTRKPSATPTTASPSASPSSSSPSTAPTSASTSASPTSTPTSASPSLTPTSSAPASTTSSSAPASQAPATSSPSPVASSSPSRAPADGTSPRTSPRPSPPGEVAR